MYDYGLNDTYRFGIFKEGDFTKGKINIKTVVGIVVLGLVAIAISFFGYRVIVTAGEKPGKLSSISVAATNLNYNECSFKEVSKVSYETMKYGFMDGQMIKEMDYLDSVYERERMEEIRAVNDLTAMSEKTADRIAYAQLKAQRDAEIEKAKKAAEAAAAAKLAREKELENQRLFANSGYILTTNSGSGDTASSGGRVGAPVYADSHGKSLGKFVITAYCTCKICCGIYSGHNRTSSGTIPTSNRTIAVDTNVIPFGTRVVFNGQVYVAEDRGGAIKGKRIDLFFMTHKEALNWGKRTLEVFLAE